MKNNNIENYLKNKNITFNNIEIFDNALTHSSYRNEHNIKEDYEQLEFIGDAVLEFISTKLIYKYRPELNEGDMTKLRSCVVQSSSLANYARKDQLYNLIKVGNSISVDELKKSDKYLEDVFEAIVGAIWKDSGLENAEKFISNFILSDIKNMQVDNLTDYKSKFQEIIQEKYKENVEYLTIDAGGPDHMKTFTTTAVVNNKKIILSNGIGTSKKDAEKDAAKKYLMKEGIIDE